MCVFCDGHSQGRVVHEIFEVDPAAVLSEIAKAAVTYCNTNTKRRYMLINGHQMIQETIINEVELQMNIHFNSVFKYTKCMRYIHCH